jgi:hypothetical protein
MEENNFVRDRRKRNRTRHTQWLPRHWGYSISNNIGFQRRPRLVLKSRVSVGFCALNMKTSIVIDVVDVHATFKNQFRKRQKYYKHSNYKTPSIFKQTRQPSPESIDRRAARKKAGSVYTTTHLLPVATEMCR